MTTAVEIAGYLGFVKEKTNHNDGPWVESILRVVDCKRGDPWCAAFVSYCLAIAHYGKSPLPMTASCQAFYDFGRTHGLMVTEPKAGDVFLVLTAAGHAHHTGFVIGPSTNGRAPTIEGNTNIDGSREGWGVFKRTRALGSQLVFLRPSESVAHTGNAVGAT